jgi:uncharacterized protein YndB with AHSA1/START domain
MADEGISITRIFDAPREVVWKEWTDPERFADWYGGPQAEIPLSTVTMDVRPGGQWRATMLFGPERHEIKWEGEYVEVVEPERLVFTVTDQPGQPTSELVIVVLTDLGDGRTEMQFQQRGGGLTPDGYRAAGQGWMGFFDAIDERLAGA